MGLQVGLPPLDFGGIRGRVRQRYIGAVHAGLDRMLVPLAPFALMGLLCVLEGQRLAV